MTAITREVLDLHLRHTNEKFESQLESCKAFLADQRESSQRLFDERFRSISKWQDAERENLKVQQAIHAQEYGRFRKEIKEEINEFKKASNSLKITVVLTGIGTATSIIFGVATFNSTLIAAHASSFDVGKQLAQTAAKISADLNETRERDRRFNAQQSHSTLSRDGADTTSMRREE